MRINSFQTDKDLENGGVWVPIEDGAELKVARTGNRAYRKLFTRLTRPYQRQIDSNRMPEELSESIIVEVMANTVLLGWKGMEEDGVAVEYSVEKAMEWLKAYPEFRRLVSSLADDVELFRSQSIAGEAEALGNG